MVNSLTDALMRRLNPVQSDVPVPRESPKVPRGPFYPFGVGAPVQLAQAQGDPQDIPVPEEKTAPRSPTSSSSAPGRYERPPSAGNINLGGATVPDEHNIDAGKPPQNEIIKDLYQTQEQYDQLRHIQESFDPNMLKANKILQNWMTAKKDKWEGSMVGDILGKATPQEKADLAKYAASRTAAVSFLSNYLKQMSGGQVTEGEAGRLYASMPNAGTGAINGLFDADSPTEFRSKLNENLKVMRRSIARRSYYLKRGVPLADYMDKMENDMPLFTGEFNPKEGGWRNAMVERAKELQAQKYPDEYIAKRLRDEFGLDQ